MQLIYCKIHPFVTQSMGFVKTPQNKDIEFSLVLPAFPFPQSLDTMEVISVPIVLPFQNII